MFRKLFYTEYGLSGFAVFLTFAASFVFVIAVLAVACKYILAG